jgi:2-dehydropantoate 2-reductase
MKIAIVGSGGVGGYFGAKLAKAGHDVRFFARGRHLEAMRSQGLTVKSLKGDFTLPNVKATDSLLEIGCVDVAIVCVKAYQLKELAPQLKPLLKSDTVVLPLQNGVMAASELSDVVGDKYVIGGLCRIIAKIDAPGIINHFGVEPTIVMGELDGALSERVQHLARAFNDAGFTARAVDNIETELWKKFIAICVSGLLAITKSTYGELRQLPETRLMMLELFTEIYELSKAVGVGIEDGFVEKTMAFIDTFPFDTTSSLARDVWEGKPSEIDYQNGTVVSLGQQYGVPTPINRFIYSAIMPMEMRARTGVGLL